MNECQIQQGCKEAEGQAGNGPSLPPSRWRTRRLFAAETRGPSQGWGPRGWAQQPACGSQLSSLRRGVVVWAPCQPRGKGSLLISGLGPPRRVPLPTRVAQGTGTGPPLKPTQDSSISSPEDWSGESDHQGSVLGSTGQETRAVGAADPLSRQLRGCLPRRTTPRSRVLRVTPSAGHTAQRK